MRELLKTNATLDVNWKDGTRSTALHQACLNGRDSEVVILLAHSNIDVNQKNNSGQTPFYVACENGKTSCVRVLLKDSRVLVNEPTASGYTPLQRAASGSHFDVIKLWIVSGREMDLGQPGVSKTDAVAAVTIPTKKTFESERNKRSTEFLTLLENLKKNQEETRNQVRNELGITGTLALFPPSVPFFFSSP